MDMTKESGDRAAGECSGKMLCVGLGDQYVIARK